MKWRVESRTGAVTLVSRWLLTAFSRRRLSPVGLGSVSCSRSSNRTGRFLAPGRELHPLKSSAFSRRTFSTITVSESTKGRVPFTISTILRQIGGRGMALPDGLRAVTGAQQLHDWFGYWPTFHDAEVI